MPVKAMASCAGKKTIITGVSIVPNPNPEKNVSNEAPKAVKQIIMYSIFNNSKFSEANVSQKV